MLERGIAINDRSLSSQTGAQCRRVLWSACVWMMFASGGQAATVVRSFMVADPLGRQLGVELVSETFEATAGACTPGGLRLTGPFGEVPLQLTDVEYWPDGSSVRSARVWFAVDLARRSSQAMQLLADNAPPQEVPGQGSLKVTEASGIVEIETPAFGARFHVGEEEFSPPRAAGEVPPPLAGLRHAGGTWFGGSRMYGPKRIVRKRSSLEARGPVFAEIRHTYEYEDGMAINLTARIVAGGSTIDWSMNVTPLDREEAVGFVTDPWPSEDPFKPLDASWRDGWQLLLAESDDPPLMLATKTEFGSNRWGKREYRNGQWVDEAADIVISKQPPGLIMNLVPWNDWWDDETQTEIVINHRDAPSPWFIRAVDAGEWVEPSAPGTWAPWGNRRMRQQWVPLVHGQDGSVYFQFSLTGGHRRFIQGLVGAGVGLELDRTRRLVLSWPEARQPHPRLFMSGPELEQMWRGQKDEAALSRLVASAGQPTAKPTDADCFATGAWLLSGDRRVAKAVRLTDRLKSHLGLLGGFDRMRHTPLVCGMYDATLAGDLLSAKERRLCRAQMAFLAYQIADPATWSMERGYCSGNLNMSVAHVTNLGMMACVLSDHPNAEDWSREPLAMIERMLANQVGPAGEWPESVANYASVSIGAMLPLAVAASRVGWKDYVNDDRIKRLMLYMAKQYTPPDPRPAEGGVVGVSRLPPVGRGGARGRDGLPGLMARATMQSDAAYSAGQQWVWLRCGAPREIPDARLGGWEHVYLDRRLPAALPNWSLDVFPEQGGIMRHGLGTPAEWYLYLICQRQPDFLSESGGIPLVFAKGSPIIAHFSGGYAEREELFINRLLPARERGDHEFRMQHFYHEGQRSLTAWADTPGMQYLRGKFSIEKPGFRSHEATAHDRMKDLPSWPAVPNQADGAIDWGRQVLFVKDADPAGPNTIFIRDTVSGGQPTIWQMWFVSDGIVDGSRPTPAGNDTTDGPKGLSGDRFVVRGQYGIDTDLFVATPRQEPRNTLRWATSYNYRPLNGVQEAMDLLHLQRPDDGAYFVALSPRRRDEPKATYESLAGGLVIKVSTEKSVDFGFLASDATDAEAEYVRFNGTAGSVAYRPVSTTASLGDRGGIQFTHQGPEGPEAWELAATASAAVRLKGDSLKVWFSQRGEPMGIRLEGPAKWVSDGAVEGVRMEHRPDGLRITANGIVTSATFQRAQEGQR